MTSNYKNRGNPSTNPFRTLAVEFPRLGLTASTRRKRRLGTLWQPFVITARGPLQRLNSKIVSRKIMAGFPIILRANKTLNSKWRALSHRVVCISIWIQYFRVAYYRLAKRCQLKTWIAWVWTALLTWSTRSVIVILKVNCRLINNQFPARKKDAPAKTRGVSNFIASVSPEETTVGLTAIALVVEIIKIMSRRGLKPYQGYSRRILMPLGQRLQLILITLSSSIKRIIIY